MTQYFRNFSEYTLNSYPNDWSLRWDNKTLEVQSEAGANNGLALVFIGSGSAGSNMLHSWNTIDADGNRANVEILTRVKRDSGHSSLPNMGVLGRGSNSSVSGYAIGFAGTSNHARIYRVDNGTRNLLSSGAGGANTGTYYWIRFRINSDQLKLKVWSGAIGDEPGSWTVETTDGTYSSAGYVGVYRGLTSNNVYYDVFGVGTNGDTAPSSALGGGGETVALTPATAAISVVAPTVVLGSISTTLTPANAKAAVVAPTVILGSQSATLSAAVASASVIAPTVQYGSIGITLQPANAVVSVVAPTVQQSVLLPNLHCDASDTDNLFTTYSNTGVHTGAPADGNAVQVWDNEIGSIADVSLKFVAAGAEPNYRSTTPLMALPCLDFDGATDGLETQNQAGTAIKAASSFVSANAFTILIAFYAEAITKNNATIYNNHCLIGDQGQFFGLYLKDDAGVKKLVAYNWDGNIDTVEAAIQTGKNYVAMMRHEGGSLYLKVYDGGIFDDDGFEVFSFSGNTSNLTTQLRIGLSGTNTHFNGRVGEFKVWDTALSSGDLTTEVNYFRAKWLVNVGEVVTLAPAIAKAAVVTPTVVQGSIGLTLAPASAAVSVVAPLVEESSIQPTLAPATAITSVVSPIVQLGNVTILLPPLEAYATVINPNVVLVGGSSLNKTIKSRFRKLHTKFGSVRKLSIKAELAKL